MAVKLSGSPWCCRKNVARLMEFLSEAAILYREEGTDGVSSRGACPQFEGFADC